MVVPISKFRKEIFSLAESALKGESVMFIHKGVKFKVIPETATDKLANISPLQVINPDFEFEAAHNNLLAEMETEWEKDWREI